MTESLWGGGDVARHTGLTSERVRQLRRVGRMPEPEFQVGREYLWHPATIRGWWMARGGRLPPGRAAS